ncbi:hypothetical protein EUX98_g2716 [Antrodiella citrinella]|uniref:Tubulin-folding cofactor D ARM repeats domain-containing protein n=1 Tax=Antrodiella citrinella TaxID=2447956 RepID=A0A4V3XJ28_9APHY|nr:hypothetical protein EUX98_g2716 [Antrodiella citrinella]
MDESQLDNKIFTAFEKRQEFIDLQDRILYPKRILNTHGEDEENYGKVLAVISVIFDEYLEQAYLLDSHLESLLTPAVDQLKIAARHAQSDTLTPVEQEHIGRLAFLLYLYVKFRGYKTITRFFPHEIADLDIALGFLLLPDGPATVARYWSLRYVMLLWLSLICMLPFDLEQFDEHEHRGQTASNIELVAKSHLNKAGVERDAAAILLSRLYTRKDMIPKFPIFLQWCKEVMGVLRVLCELTKSGAAELVQDHLPSFLDIATSTSEHQNLMSNTVIRKLKTKLVSRVILRLLPANKRKPRQRGKVLVAKSDESHAEHQGDEDLDVPEETEPILDELLQRLQDKDTIVRYSAAKGIARIADRLPSEFSDQILDTILQLYTIHSMALAQMHELPTVAEATWHGASLACAELARRGLIADDKLSDVLQWQGKALYFDIRQGAHSIGSSVRDAASYVIWSLAKAQSVDALAPFMLDLSQKLITVSIYDREELCPHGIPVLGKTDFYSVGLKRNAFLVAAAEVAVYEEYRSVLIEHVVSVTLRHWDPVLRQLGAQSLREICQSDMLTLVPDITARLSEYLAFSDSTDVHGALLTLTELAAACGDSQELKHLKCLIFSYIADIPSTTVLSARHEIVTAAACNLIAASIAIEDVEANPKVVPPWRKIIEFGLKSRGVAIQEAAAEAMSAISKLVDCSGAVER